MVVALRIAQASKTHWTGTGTVHSGVLVPGLGMGSAAQLSAATSRNATSASALTF